MECSREKAEALLSLSRHYGSLLLRPVSSEPNCKYALSYRLETAGSVLLSSSLYIVASVDRNRTVFESVDNFVPVSGKKGVICDMLNLTTPHEFYPIFLSNKQ